MMYFLLDVMIAPKSEDHFWFIFDGTLIEFFTFRKWEILKWYSVQVQSFYY